MSITEDGMALTDSDGNPVLDVNGNDIVIPSTYRSSELAVDQFGNLTYPDASGNQQNLGIQIGLAYFPNAGGLEKGSGSNYLQSDASGEPTIYTAGELNSKIVSGYLESSNVQAADEMVNMIIAQRAYEMNSKAITASDEMLQQANNLRS
jgi:flagellar basal-body rod protein FlgG